MRAKEFITEAISIDQSLDGGELSGYVVTSREPHLRNYLQSQGADISIAEKLLGKYQTIAVIRNMYVDEDNRGQGIGNELMSLAIDDASNNEAEAIVLVADIHEENTINLVHWYEGFGFEMIGDAGGDPIMVMEL